jgi:hypothetical protein
LSIAGRCTWIWVVGALWWVGLTFLLVLSRAPSDSMRRALSRLSASCSFSFGWMIARALRSCGESCALVLSRAPRASCRRSFFFPHCCHKKAVFAALMLFERYPCGMLFVTTPGNALSSGFLSVAHGLHRFVKPALRSGFLRFASALRVTKQCAMWTLLRARRQRHTTWQKGDEKHERSERSGDNP